MNKLLTINYWWDTSDIPSKHLKHVEDVLNREARRQFTKQLDNDMREGELLTIVRYDTDYHLRGWWKHTLIDKPLTIEPIDKLPQHMKVKMAIDMHGIKTGDKVAIEELDFPEYEVLDVVGDKIYYSPLNDGDLDKRFYALSCYCTLIK